MSKDSNTSRRRDSAVEKSKYRSDSRAEMQKTFAEWTARLEDSERKEKKLSAKLQLQAALMTGKCDTIERKEAEVAAMRERIEVGKRQLIKCGRERDSIATDYDQLHADTQDLQQKYKQVQAEVKEMQCKKAQADEEVQRLKNEIEEHKSRYGKMATRLADYKMRFNEALDEQQRFYRHQKAFVDRAILDAVEMKRKSHDESERAIARGELVRDDLSKALEACRAFSRRESDTVNATLRDIEAKLQDTQQQLLQEVERSNNLESQLDDQNQHDKLSKSFRAGMEQILAQIASDKELTKTEESDLLLKRQAVSSRGQELQRRDEVINGLTAALKGHFDELEAALRTTNTSQVDLRHSMTQVQESIQNQLSTQLEGHCSREADMRQELIEMAEEKTQCATLLDVRYRQLKEVELSHEKKTEEAQGLRLQIASLESTANQEATMADDIAELRQALSNKDAQSTILQQQIQDLNVTHQNEIGLLKKNMELEISGLQEEANVKTLKICDMESQLRDQAEMRQKDTGDIKESLANIYESSQQKREKPLRSIVSDTIDAAMQTEYRGTTNSGCDVVFEDTIVSKMQQPRQQDYAEI
ncbi:hypothetical protein HYQ44_013644 [Verticillium longisporum]|nr:hypothetical protein HYQ44_013644 [Verticillium longisporum]